MNARAVNGWAREVARAVERLLDARGISDRQIASQIGRSQNYVSIRLRGESSFSLTDIEDIADALGFDAGSFLAGVSEGGRTVTDAMDVSDVHGVDEGKKSTYGLAALRGKRKADEPHAE